MQMSDMKARRKQGTGTDMTLFLGLEYVIEGFTHTRLPRDCRDYEQMTVAEILDRVRGDVGELVARAYPAAREEWAKRFAPAWWRDWGVPHDKRCRHITEKLANRLRPGLWKEINSTDSETAEKAQKELTQLLNKYFEAEPKLAAHALAFVTKQAAYSLEGLSVKRAALMKEVARGFSLWPVNMGLRAKVNNKDGKRTTEMVLTRRDFAEKYLKGLGVNTDSRFPESAHSGAKKISPFRIAAEQLYTDLLLMKHSPPNWNFLKISSWAKKLFALPEPMTTANAGDWWKVAKFWLDEQWDLDQEAFAPLIAVSKKWKNDFGSTSPYGAGSGPLKRVKRKVPITEAPLYPSELRSTVIDSRLKEAFCALAKPADL